MGKVNKPVVIIGTLLLVVVIYLAFSFTTEKFSQPEADTLIVGVNTPFPPFEYLQGDKVVGFDMDMIQLFGEKTNKRIVIKDFNDFDTLFPALVNGEIDIIASAVTITPERDEIADFSIAYFNSSQAVITLTSSPINDWKYEDGIRIGCQKGTTTEDWIIQNYNTTPVTFGDLEMGFQLLRLKQIDIIIMDEPSAISSIHQRSGLKIIGVIETNEKYGFAVQENDPKNILPELNSMITELQNTDEYSELLKKWELGI